MTDLRVGDLLANGAAVVEDSKTSEEYVVMNPTDRSLVKFRPINGYKDHDTILAHSERLFCIDCAAEAKTVAEKYPYVRMLQKLPAECDEKNSGRFMLGPGKATPSADRKL